MPRTKIRNLCVLNDGSKTYVHRYGDTTSALDLTVVDPSLVLDFNWTILDDLHGSDHYPVLLTGTSNEEDSPERLNLKKADWPKFESECRGRIREETIFSGNSIPIQAFTRILNDISEDCIPRTGCPRNIRTNSNGHNGFSIKHTTFRASHIINTSLT